ncbi:MAG: endonuclease/exonuclease/phosphatase family protein [Pseudomonadota bacterium]
MTFSRKTFRLRRTHRYAVLTILALMMQGCATVAMQDARLTVHSPTALLTEYAGACRTGWASSPRLPAASLDPDRITLLNWNIKKGSSASWRQQLEVLGGDADLITLQEAPLASPGWQDITSNHYHAFAPGWRSRKTATGVMTLSDAAHLVQCNLQAREPWLRSPKATLATEYALTGMAESLLVVNVHIVNFSLGLSAFDRQLQQISTIVSQHQGPIILTGDFNTWRHARMERVRSLVAGHKLQPVAFRTDVRKRFLGRPLDHVYVRGLRVIEATTTQTQASDHNPMQVWLSAY